MTPRTVAGHARLIAAADMQFPIILCAEGRIMDGMHRVLKALNEDRTSLTATRFDETPKPDFEGIEPDALSYDPREFTL